MNNKYKIELSEDQARTIVRATELFARIFGGQFEDIWYQLWESPHFSKLDEETRYAMRDLFEELHKLYTGSSSMSFGAGSSETPENAHIAWDLYQVIRYRLAWDNNPEGKPWNVHFNTPMKTSESDFAKIEKVEES